jgi:hypothetical protein
MPFQYICESCGTMFTRHQRPHGKNPFRFCSRSCKNHLSFEQRFWSKVDIGDPDACWLWRAGAAGGYGIISRNGRIARAHRVSWEFANRRQSKAEVIRHVCDNPLCCNPAHLMEGTKADNRNDMVERGRGRFLRGEELPFSKLTEDHVLDMREAFASGESKSALARRFGVGWTTVYQVVRGDTWSHVTLREVGE